MLMASDKSTGFSCFGTSIPTEAANNSTDSMKSIPSYSLKKLIAFPEALQAKQW